MIRLILVACLLDLAWSNPNDVIVVTTKGPIKGYRTGDKNYTTFFGVPYAKVDEANPFGNTKEYPNFVKPFNANDSSIRCPQAYFNPGGILQCLILNIYVPHRADPKQTLPVFVWFHGGGFAFGSAGEYGGQYLVQHDVIVITANYRLGPYGFLCLDDPKVPGNQGLKDQIEALRWIRKNIKVFGGDASKVTIAGESYGGGAVDLHLYSSYETLFDKAIVQSGCILDEGFWKKPDYNAAIKLAKQIGHNVTKTTEALALLTKEEPLVVMNAAKDLEMLLTVCKEKSFKGVAHFVTNDPYHLNKAKVKNIKIMIGYNSKEYYDAYFNKSAEFYKNISSIFYDKLKETFDFTEEEFETLTNIIWSYYLGNKSISADSSLELADFTADFLLNFPTEWSVNNYIEQGAKVFKYVFSYIGGSPYMNETGVGAVHTEELNYLFQWYTELVTDEQRSMRDMMTTLWTNFVKYGNPTPSTSELLPTVWQPIPVVGKSRPYLNIDLAPTMMDHAYRERMAFWQLFWHAYERKAILYEHKDSC